MVTYLIGIFTTFALVIGVDWYKAKNESNDEVLPVTPNATITTNLISNVSYEEGWKSKQSSSMEASKATPILTNEQSQNRLYALLHKHYKQSKMGNHLFGRLLEKYILTPNATNVKAPLHPIATKTNEDRKLNAVNEEIFTIKPNLTFQTPRYTTNVSKLQFQNIFHTSLQKHYQQSKRANLMYRKLLDSYILTPNDRSKIVDLRIKITTDSESISSEGLRTLQGNLRDSTYVRILL